MNYAEKRRHPRLPVFSAAMLVIADDGYLTEVKDLSQGGARIGRPRHWQGSTGIDARVFLIFDQETVIGLGVRIVRVGVDDLGLEFLPGQDARIQSLLYETRFLDQEAP